MLSSQHLKPGEYVLETLLDSFQAIANSKIENCLKNKNEALSISLKCSDENEIEDEFEHVLQAWHTAAEYSLPSLMLTLFDWHDYQHSSGGLSPLSSAAATTNVGMSSNNTSGRPASRISQNSGSGALFSTSPSLPPSKNIALSTNGEGSAFTTPSHKTSIQNNSTTAGGGGEIVIGGESQLTQQQKFSPIQNHWIFSLSNEEKERLLQKRDLAVDYLFCQVLIRILPQLSYHPGNDEVANRLLDQAFCHFRYNEDYSTSQNLKDINAVADKYAEVVGCLSQTRFHLVRKKFTNQLKELRLKESSAFVNHSIISLLMGMKFFRVQMHPIDAFVACFTFLQELAQYFLDVKEKEIKHALALLFVEILLPVAAVLKHEANIPALKMFVDMLYTTCLDLSRKTKHILALFPLVTCLLCVAQRQFFFTNWPFFMTQCVTQLKRGDTRIARVSLESLVRLLWVYIIRYKCEKHTDTQQRLQTIVSSLFPKNNKSVTPKDAPNSLFIKVIHFISQEKLDFAVKEIIFDLLGITRAPIRALVPERMNIGLCAFLVIAHSLQQREGEPPMPQQHVYSHHQHSYHNHHTLRTTTYQVPGGTLNRMKPSLVGDTLTEATAHSLGIQPYMSQVRKAFDSILKLLDQQVVRNTTWLCSSNESSPLDSNATGNSSSVSPGGANITTSGANTSGNSAIGTNSNTTGGERDPKMELLRTCVCAIPRLLPSETSKKDLIYLLSRICLHNNSDLRQTAQASLYNLVLEFPAWRPKVLHGFIDFFHNDIPDANPQQVEICAKIVYNILCQWKNGLLKDPCTLTSDRVNREPLYECEGFCLILLCYQNSACVSSNHHGIALIRRLAVQCLREVRFLCQLLPIANDTNCCIDVMDDSIPSLLSSLLPLLPQSERNHLLLNANQLDFSILADRSVQHWAIEPKSPLILPPPPSPALQQPQQQQQPIANRSMPNPSGLISSPWGLSVPGPMAPSSSGSRSSIVMAATGFLTGVGSSSGSSNQLIDNSSNVIARERGATLPATSKTTPSTEQQLESSLSEQVLNQSNHPSSESLQRSGLISAGNNSGQTHLFKNATIPSMTTTATAGHFSTSTTLQQQQSITTNVNSTMPFTSSMASLYCNIETEDPIVMNAGAKIYNHDFPSSASTSSSSSSNMSKLGSDNIDLIDDVTDPWCLCLAHILSWRHLLVQCPHAMRYAWLYGLNRLKQISQQVDPSLQLNENRASVLLRTATKRPPPMEKEPSQMYPLFRNYALLCCCIAPSFSGVRLQLTHYLTYHDKSIKRKNILTKNQIQWKMISSNGNAATGAGGGGGATTGTTIAGGGSGVGAIGQGMNTTGIVTNVVGNTSIGTPGVATITGVVGSTSSGVGPTSTPLQITSPEHPSDGSPNTARDKSLGGTLTPNEKAPNMIKLLTPFLRCEVNELRDAVVTALGRINAPILRDVLDDLHPYMREAIDKKQENLRRKRRRDNLRCYLLRIFEIMAQHDVFAFRESLPAISQKTLSEFLESIAQYLDASPQPSSSVDTEALVLETKKHFCRLFIHLVRRMPRGRRVESLSKGFKQTIFTTISHWSGPYSWSSSIPPPSSSSSNSHDDNPTVSVCWLNAIHHPGELIDANICLNTTTTRGSSTSLLNHEKSTLSSWSVGRFIATSEMEYLSCQAMAALLSCGPLFNESWLVDEPFPLLHWIGLLLYSPEHRIQRLGEECLVHLLIWNPELGGNQPTLLEWSIEQCYQARKPHVRRLAFNAIFKMFQYKPDYICTEVTVILLTLVYSSLADILLQECAQQLLQLLYHRFFCSMENSTEGLMRDYFWKSIPSLKSIELSCQLSLQHPDLTMSLFSEFCWRFERCCSSLRPILSQCIQPWLYNIHLIDVFYVLNPRPSDVLFNATTTTTTSNNMTGTGTGLIDDHFDLKSIREELPDNGWGSIKATEMVLNNLYYLNLRLGVSQSDELMSIWRTLSRPYGVGITNLDVILHYLIVITSLAPHTLLTTTKRILTFLTNSDDYPSKQSQKSDKIIDFLITELQMIEPSNFQVERTTFAPFVRVMPCNTKWTGPGGIAGTIAATHWFDSQHRTKGNLNRQRTVSDSESQSPQSLNKPPAPHKISTSSTSGNGTSGIVTGGTASGASGSGGGIVGGGASPKLRTTVAAVKRQTICIDGHHHATTVPLFTDTSNKRLSGTDENNETNTSSSRDSRESPEKCAELESLLYASTEDKFGTLRAPRCSSQPVGTSFMSNQQGLFLPPSIDISAGFSLGSHHFVSLRTLSPHPLPMPSHAAYYAPLDYWLPSIITNPTDNSTSTTTLPWATHFRNSVILMLLTDLIILHDIQQNKTNQLKAASWTKHIPLLLHCALLSMDHGQPLVHEQCKLLLLNLLQGVLCPQVDLFRRASLLLQATLTNNSVAAHTPLSVTNQSRGYLLSTEGGPCCDRYLSNMHDSQQPPTVPFSILCLDCCRCCSSKENNAAISSGAGGGGAVSGGVNGIDDDILNEFHSCQLNTALPGCVLPRHLPGHNYNALYTSISEYGSVMERAPSTFSINSIATLIPGHSTLPPNSNCNTGTNANIPFQSLTTTTDDSIASKRWMIPAAEAFIRVNNTSQKLVQFLLSRPGQPLWPWEDIVPCKFFHSKRQELLDSVSRLDDIPQQRTSTTNMNDSNRISAVSSLSDDVTNSTDTYLPSARILSRLVQLIMQLLSEYQDWIQQSQAINTTTRPRTPGHVSGGGGAGNNNLIGGVRKRNAPSSIFINTTTTTTTAANSSLSPQIAVLRDLRELWPEMALLMGLRCTHRHHAARSLQIYRSLHTLLNHKVQMELLSRLMETISDSTEEVQSYVCELYLTIENGFDRLDWNLNENINTTNTAAPAATSAGSPTYRLRQFINQTACQEEDEMNISSAPCSPRNTTITAATGSMPPEKSLSDTRDAGVDEVLIDSLLPPSSSHSSPVHSSVSLDKLPIQSSSDTPPILRKLRSQTSSATENETETTTTGGGGGTRLSTNRTPGGGGGSGTTPRRLAPRQPPMVAGHDITTDRRQEPSSPTRTQLQLSKKSQENNSLDGGKISTAPLRASSGNNSPRSSSIWTRDLNLNNSTQSDNRDSRQGRDTSEDILCSIYWTAIALLESDHDYEYQCGLSLLYRWFCIDKKFSFVDYLTRHQRFFLVDAKWRSTTSSSSPSARVHRNSSDNKLLPLLLKGITNANLYEPSCRLLSRVIVLDPSVIATLVEPSPPSASPLGDSLTFPICVLTLLPWLMDNFVSHTPPMHPSMGGMTLSSQLYYGGGGGFNHHHHHPPIPPSSSSTTTTNNNHRRPPIACIVAAENIAWRAEQLSQNIINSTGPGTAASSLTSLGTVMKLFSSASFNKDVSQWVKCCVKYLLDGYGRCAADLMAFLVQFVTLSHSSTFMHVALAQITNCVIQSIDLTRPDLERSIKVLIGASMTQFMQTSQWAEVLKCVKAVVARSSILITPPVTSEWALNLQVPLVPLPEAETPRLELPGRTLDYVLDVRRYPVAGLQETLPNNGGTLTESIGQSSTLYSTCIITTPNWKRPSLGQIRVRERLRQLLESFDCGSSRPAILPKSPSNAVNPSTQVIFSQSTETLDRPLGSVVSSSDTTSTNDVSNTDDGKYDDSSSMEQAQILRNLDLFLDAQLPIHFLEIDSDSWADDDEDHKPPWGIRKQSITHHRDFLEHGKSDRQQRGHGGHHNSSIGSARSLFNGSNKSNHLYQVIPYESNSYQEHKIEGNNSPIAAGIGSAGGSFGGGGVIVGGGGSVGGNSDELPKHDAQLWLNSTVDDDDMQFPRRSLSMGHFYRNQPLASAGSSGSSSNHHPHHHHHHHHHAIHHVHDSSLNRIRDNNLSYQRRPSTTTTTTRGGTTNQEFGQVELVNDLEIDFDDPSSQMLNWSIGSNSGGGGGGSGGTVGGSGSRRRVLTRSSCDDVDEDDVDLDEVDLDDTVMSELSNSQRFSSLRKSSTLFSQQQQQISSSNGEFHDFTNNLRNLIELLDELERGSGAGATYNSITNSPIKRDFSIYFQRILLTLCQSFPLVIANILFTLRTKVNLLNHLDSSASSSAADAAILIQLFHQLLDCMENTARKYLPFIYFTEEFLLLSSTNNKGGILTDETRTSLTFIAIQLNETFTSLLRKLNNVQTIVDDLSMTCRKLRVDKTTIKNRCIQSYGKLHKCFLQLQTFWEHGVKLYPFASSLLPKNNVVKNDSFEKLLSSCVRQIVSKRLTQSSSISSSSSGGGGGRGEGAGESKINNSWYYIHVDSRTAGKKSQLFASGYKLFREYGNESIDEQQRDQLIMPVKEALLLTSDRHENLFISPACLYHKIAQFLCIILAHMESNPINDTRLLPNNGFINCILTNSRNFSNKNFQIEHDFTIYLTKMAQIICHVHRQLKILESNAAYGGGGGSYSPISPRGYSSGGSRLSYYREGKEMDVNNQDNHSPTGITTAAQPSSATASVSNVPPPLTSTMRSTKRRAPRAPIQGAFTSSASVDETFAYRTLPTLSSSGGRHNNSGSSSKDESHYHQQQQQQEQDTSSVNSATVIQPRVRRTTSDA